MIRAAALALLVGALAAGPAFAAPPNAADLEAELVCPVCETTLDQSNAPVAERMKTFIRVRIAAGDSEQEIKDALVAQFGTEVLARAARRRLRAPRVAAPARRARRRRGRRRPARPQVEPPRAALRAPGSRPARPGARAPRGRRARTLRRLTVSWTSIPVAFLAGMVSFLAPCVLPLVPAYLSAVSAVDADQLGKPGTARRVLTGSVPFVLGFTAFFVLLGVGRSSRRREDPRRPVPARAHRRVRPRRLRPGVHGLASVARAAGRRWSPAGGTRTRLARAPRRRLRGVRGPVHRPGPRGDPRPRRLVRHRLPGCGATCRLLARAGAAIRPRRCPLHARDVGVSLAARPLSRDPGRRRGGHGRPRLLLFFERFYVLRVYLNRFLEWLGLEPAF